MFFFSILGVLTVFHMTQDKIRQQGQEGGGDGPAQDKIVVQVSEAGPDKLAQAAATDKGCHGGPANEDDKGGPYSCQDNR